MKPVRTLLVLGCANLLLAGCFGDKINTKKKITCSDSDGIHVVKNIITEQVEKELKNNTDLSLSSIRASINNLTLDVTGIRTAKEDPNSTKVFCDAEFQIGIPATMINDANIAMETAEYDNNIGALIEELGYQQSSTAANTYHTTISYNLQPSDDGQHIFAQLEDGSPQLALVDILYWSMSKNTLIAEATNEKRMIAEEAARLAEEEKARQEALNAQEAAELERAKVAYTGAVNRLNATWNSLSEETREALRPEQRAINKEREAACKAESLSVEGNTTAKEIYRLNCEVQAMDARNDELLYLQ